MKKLFKLTVIAAILLITHYSCIQPTTKPNTPTPTNNNSINVTVDGTPWSSTGFGALQQGAGNLTAFTGDGPNSSSINFQFLQSYTGKVPLDVTKQIVIIYQSPANKTYGGTHGYIDFTSNTTAKAEGKFSATLGAGAGDSVTFTNGSFSITKMN